jgi:hypothetical protein
MKITVDVDCTPEEARKFLGLPDVAPLQESMMAQMKAQMEKTAAALDPEAIMKTLFPKVEGLADLQKAFWNQFTANRTPNP